MHKLIPLALAITLLSGCATPKGITDPPLRMAATFDEAGGLARAGESEARWWTLLDDPALASLIERALGANLDVQIAAERVLQARAYVDGAAAARLPFGSASTGAQRRRLSAIEAAPLNSPPRIGTRYDAGFDASWELDLFGRLSGQVDAAHANHVMAAARLEDVRLIVAAEVARAYFALASARERHALALQSLERQRSIARLVSTRVREGYSEPLDDRRSQSDLSMAVAAIPGLEAEMVNARARLAVLLGESPSGFRPPPSEPGDGWRLKHLAVGTPDKLLETRPDLREAEARVRSLRASAESVRAEFFPRLVLTGFLGFVAGGASAIGSAASESWFVAPRLGLPVFDYPRIQARLDAAHSDERQALHEYRKRILLAIEDVETGLARYRLGQAKLEALRRRAGQAEEASQLARIRYQAGRSDFLELLEAERTATSAKSDLSLAVAEQRIAVVSVFKAFGTGWNPVPPDRQKLGALTAAQQEEAWADDAHRTR